METLMDVQKMLLLKNLEKTQCEQQLRKLNALCRNMKSEIKKWMQSYKTHNKLIVTSDVVVTGKFEGKKATEIKKAYHGRISHMNVRYMNKIAEVCDDLELQISSIESHISKLETSINNLENKSRSMEG